MLVYLCLYGCYPFESDSMPEMFKAIMDAEYSFERDDSVSEKAQEFIKKVKTHENSKLKFKVY